MALNVALGGDGAKRKEYLEMNPDELMVIPGDRGREFAPTPEEIMNKALSMLRHGQKTPVDARKISGADKRLRLMAGFTRTEAAKMIRAGFTDKDGNFHQNEGFLLKVMVFEMNDDEAFIHNVIENAQRKDTSPIDDAHNQRRLRDQNGMSDSDITRLYEYDDPHKVSRYRRLLELSKEIQYKVHTGDMAVLTALKLLEFPEDQRAGVVTDATRSDGRVDGPLLTSKLRDHRIDKYGEGTDESVLPTSGILAVPETPVLPVSSSELAATDPAPAGTPVVNRPKVVKKTAATPPPSGRTYTKRTMTELKKWLDKERVDDGQKKFVRKLKKWLNGECKDKTLDDAFDELTDYVRS